MGWSSQWPQRHYPVPPNFFTWRWGDLVQARRHPHTLHTGGVRYRHIQKQQTCRTEFASYGGEHPTQFPGKWPTNTVAYLCVPQGPDFHAKNMCAYMNPFNCISHYMTYTQTQHTILLWTIYVPQLEFWITLHVDIFFSCNTYHISMHEHASALPGMLQRGSKGMECNFWDGMPGPVYLWASGCPLAWWWYHLPNRLGKQRWLVISSSLASMLIVFGKLFLEKCNISNGCFYRWLHGQW